MASRTSIANIAMSIIGNEPISDLNESSDEARLAKKYFDQAFASALAEYPWGWALVRKVLAADAEPPEFGFKHRYMLPADCIRPFWVGHDDIELTEDQAWVREGDFILTDVEAPLQVKFTCRSKSLARMDPWIEDVCGASLALRMMQTNRGSDTSVDRVQAIYNMWVSNAKRLEKTGGNMRRKAPPSGFEKAMER